MRILTVRQMTEIDRLSTDKFGIPSLLLMENAGIQVYLTLEELFGEELRDRRIVIVCGKGNNGGDGLVVARQLLQRGILPDVFLLGRAQDVRGDARINLDIYLNSGQPVREIASETQVPALEEALIHCDIVLDAILGTGLSQPLRGRYQAAVEAINRSPAFVLAVDIPSGMFSDALEDAPLNVNADVTVTFTAPKIAHILNRNQEALGALKIVPIGSPSSLLENPGYRLNLLERDVVAEALPRRRTCSHKGDFGHIAIVAGSQGKTGAAVLSALAALRCGAGLVTACVPERVQGWVAGFRPEVMTEGMPSTEAGTFSKAGLKRLLEVLSRKDAVALGPGITTHEDTVKLVRHIVRACEIPLILDADGLNAFEGSPDLIRNPARSVTVLTPHPGEFARLLGKAPSEVFQNKLELASDFAQRLGVWLVLKDFRTLVAEPSGQIHVCPLGNPGMATAGMGDVLTGVVTSMVGQLSAHRTTSQPEITRAVSAAVYLHSLAGDLAVEDSGEPALTAGLVLDFLGKAFREVLA